MQPQQSTIDLLRDLIQFDTTSRNSNLNLIDYVASLLQQKNVAYQLTHNRDKSKANLFATLGQSKAPGVVLSGHTDVVPVDGQDWLTDPFKVEIIGDKLFGRGACDMKGFIAICLSKIDSILQADLPIPIHFAFSYDEEVGCFGVIGLLESLAQQGIKPKACIIGEPSNMSVIRAHKGILFKRCDVHGHAAHSSLIDQGVNAVTAAARIIAKIDDVQQDIVEQGPFDNEFDPPYTTLHCGVIKGGTVNNIIPEHCQFEFEIRNLPTQNPLPLFFEIERYAQTKLLPGMKAVSDQADIKWSDIAEFPSMNIAIDDAVIQSTLALTKNQATAGKVSYGTEGGHFQNAGISTVICGPGSIEQAHKPNEFIQLQQLYQGEQFLQALISSLKH